MVGKRSGKALLREEGMSLFCSAFTIFLFIIYRTKLTDVLFARPRANR